MWLSFVINIALIFLSVTIHYTFLDRVALHWSITRRHFSTRLFMGSLVAILAHIAEVWLYALAYYFCHNRFGLGYLSGEFDGSLLDCVYYSFTTYTTLGIGDIQPEGWLRFTTGVEALTGLILIAWTASFMFMCMQGQWLSVIDKNKLED